MSKLLVSMLFLVSLNAVANSKLLGYMPLKGMENVARIELYAADAPASSWAIPGCNHAKAARMHTTEAQIKDKFGCWIVAPDNDTVFVTIPGQDGSSPLTNAYSINSFTKPHD